MSEPKRMVFLAVVLVALASVPAGAAEFCNAAPVCTITAGMVKSCQQSFSITPALPVMSDAFTIANNATCMHSITGSYVFMVTARAPTVNPPARTCQLRFMLAANTHTCRIDAADGLPVELMDFEVSDTEDDALLPASEDIQRREGSAASREPARR